MITWLVLGAAICFAILVLALMSMHGKKAVTLDKVYFEQRWNDVQTFLQSENARQMAVIEADKLLDEALKRRHFAGKTMGERMVSAQKYFSNNNAVWAAHKLRNRLVHEHNARPKPAEITWAAKSFRQALKDLGAL